MDISDLTATQKRWYQALWNETGGGISPAAVAALYPEATTEEATTEEATTSAP